MLGDHDTVHGRETARADAVEGGVPEAALVRRIEEHDVEGGALAYEAIERSRDVLAENSRPVLNTERRDIVAERGHGVAVALDERRVDGAPRQGFEPHASGASEEIEDAGAR